MSIDIVTIAHFLSRRKPEKLHFQPIIVAFATSIGV
jgi:hypothetical protein